MSSIKSPIPSPDTMSFTVLELTALSGELPTDQISRLPGSDSYKANLIARLKADNLLRSYSKDGLRGLRLTAAAKRELVAQYPEQFGQILSGETMLNEPKYDLTRRRRLHRMAEVLVTMSEAGVVTRPWEKPGLFLPDGRFHQKTITAPSYYSASEVKAIGRQAVKIKSSRAAGVLFAPDSTFAVYNTSRGEMKWEYRTEMRLKVLIERDICQTRIPNQYAYITPDAIMFGATMEQIIPLMEEKDESEQEQKDKRNKECVEATDEGYKYYVLDGDFPHFYFLTLDHHGETVLRLLCDPLRKKQFDDILREDLTPARDYLMDNDGFDAQGNPVLFGYTCDMPRIHLFHGALDMYEMNGKIICFDFQKAALRRICGKRAKFVCIDFDEFERRVLHQPL